MVKNLPAMQETWIQSLGWEDPLEQGTTLFLPGESSWTEGSGRLQAMGLKSQTRLSDQHFHWWLFPQEVPCGLSWVQWWDTSTETWISIPHSPGIMSGSASLFPALHPELANVCYLQKFPITARAVSAGSCVCVAGRGRESLLIAMYQCAEHKTSLRCL